MGTRWLAFGLTTFALVLLLTSPVTASPVRALTNCAVADTSIDAEEQRFLELLNEYRQANGKQTLKFSENLNRAATWMATDMATNNRFGHEDSLGRDPFQRSVECGYPIPAGENLAAGTNKSDAYSTLELLKSSPSHDENQLTAYYVQVGIARVYYENSRYKWYWAIEFGPTDDGTSPGGAPMVTTAAPPPAVPTPTAAPPPPPQPAAAIPAAVQQPVTPRVSIAPGKNLVTWPGSGTVPWALTSAGGITAIYSFDTASGDWLLYSPNAAPRLNTLTRILPGGAYWIIATGPVDIPAP